MRIDYASLFVSHVVNILDVGVGDVLVVVSTTKVGANIFVFVVVHSISSIHEYCCRRLRELLLLFPARGLLVSLSSTKQQQPKCDSLFAIVVRKKQA